MNCKEHMYYIKLNKCMLQEKYLKNNYENKKTNQIMFQNLHCRLAHAVQRSGGLQGPSSGGDARDGRARRSAHQNAGLECRTVRGTAE